MKKTRVLDRRLKPKSTYLDGLKCIRDLDEDSFRAKTFPHLILSSDIVPQNA